MIPFPIFERMQLLAQFELRALVEELLDAPDDTARQEATAALRAWLRLHCESCGALIARELRRRDPPERSCFVCFPPPDTRGGPPAPGPDDIPF